MGHKHSPEASIQPVTQPNRFSALKLKLDCERKIAMPYLLIPISSQLYQTWNPGKKEPKKL